ncbi:hypothetical protein CU633_17840 [Bacillus sp. V3-13]|uniref:acyltransferase n=1 Tax=Bacillus sp. V3-13 TaxID=2053728 RepID=UPI000C788A08|nr:acyltransferase [Bacillus sp. V3-13]PLR76022.1 hypothetical protein CU633_17840 [Bacillus sp. V3-13]
MNILLRLKIKYDHYKIRNMLKKKGVILYNSVNLGGEPYLISIGKNTLIAPNVTFINHDESKRVAQNIRNSDVYYNSYKTGMFGKITIGENCFIGYESLILPNTKIGNNVIVGARSVVKGNLESGFVYAGSPVKKICSIDEYYEKIKDKIVLIPDSVNKSNYFELKQYILNIMDMAN